VDANTVVRVGSGSAVENAAAAAETAAAEFAVVDDDSTGNAQGLRKLPSSLDWGTTIVAMERRNREAAVVVVAGDIAVAVAVAVVYPMDGSSSMPHWTMTTIHFDLDVPSMEEAYCTDLGYGIY
jgi:hypothetical protein